MGNIRHKTPSAAETGAQAAMEAREDPPRQQAAAERLDRRRGAAGPAAIKDAPEGPAPRARS